jgi:hypothetical protein
MALFTQVLDKPSRLVNRLKVISLLINAPLKRIQVMIMMLPFLTTLIAIGLSMRGLRQQAIGAWAISFIIFLVWMKYHMTDTLNISL